MWTNIKFNKTAVLIILFTVASCGIGDDSVTSFTPDKINFDAAFKHLDFICAYEADRLPPLHPDAEPLYRYGLYLTQLKGPKNFDLAARYYRISAAHGHYRAATNLQALLSQGLTTAKHPARETINLVEELIAESIPGAFYDMGHYLELGYGVRQDSSAARYYFRRAAELGSPEAQYYVAEMLVRIKGGGVAASQMRRCAMEQNHSKAALVYGIAKQNEKEYREALLAYQVSAKAGNSTSALMLEDGFKVDTSEDDDYLGVEKDLDRSHRYDLIGSFLRRYEHLGAKVPDIDQIVPLPPAKLPEWDETFEWRRKRDEAVPPFPPSEELIARMCEEKGLDPATGWPLSGLR
jgi:hypothetical protein